LVFKTLGSAPGVSSIQMVSQQPLHNKDHFIKKLYSIEFYWIIFEGSYLQLLSWTIGSHSHHYHQFESKMRSQCPETAGYRLLFSHGKEVVKKKKKKKKKSFVYL
jgi:hypothetical protein